MLKSCKSLKYFSDLIKLFGSKSHHYSYVLKQRTDVGQGLYKPVPMNKWKAFKITEECLKSKISHDYVHNNLSLLLHFCKIKHTQEERKCPEEMPEHNFTLA